MSSAHTTAGRAVPEVPFATVQLSSDGRMRCSDSLFELLGLGPGAVVPTVELLATHVVPGDRPEWTAGWAKASRGRSAVIWHRLTTVADAERNVLTLLVPDERDGLTVGVFGYLVDVTHRLQAANSVQVSEAVERASRSRGLIEAAKGMLMVILDIDEVQAFDLLRWHSSHANVKVRDISALLVDALSQPGQGHTAQRGVVAEILSGLSPSGPVDITPATPSPSASILPAALLPRILSRAVDNASLGITVVDHERADQPLVYVNAAFERLTGYSATDVLGRNCRFLQGPGTEPERLSLIRSAIAAGQELRVVLRNYRKDGTVFFNELYLSPVRNKNNRITHYLGYQQDASERVERQDDMGRMGQQDELTGLPNERAALRRLDDLIADGSAHVAVLQSPAFVGAGLDADSVRTLVLLATRRLRTTVGHDPLVARSCDRLLVVSARPLPDRDALLALFHDRPIVTLDGPVPVAVTVGTASYPEATTACGLIEQARG